MYVAHSSSRLCDHKVRAALCIDSGAQYVVLSEMASGLQSKQLWKRGLAIYFLRRAQGVARSVEQQQTQSLFYSTVAVGDITASVTGNKELFKH